MLKVQEFLQHKSLNDLAHTHGVYARVDRYKFSLNYDQIESDPMDLLARECRGLILSVPEAPVSLERPLGPTRILALPIPRFFNLGQPGAAVVALEDSTVYEKLDGTLTNLYFDDFQNTWHVATRSVPEANLPVDGYSDHTFRTLFEKALQETSGLTFSAHCNGLARDYTYCYELMTPFNQVVVRHENFRLELLAIRNRVTGREEHPFSDASRIPVVQSYSLKTFAEVVEFVNRRDPLRHEGLVICDRNFNRVKVKSAAYVAAHLARSMIGASPRNLLEIILLNQIDDILEVLSDTQKAEAECMRLKLLEYTARMDKMFAEFTPATRKELALKCRAGNVWIAPLMSQWEKKTERTLDWIVQNKCQNGSFTASFLDKLLKEIGWSHGRIPT